MNKEKLIALADQLISESTCLRKLVEEIDGTGSQLNAIHQLVNINTLSLQVSSILSPPIAPPLMNYDPNLTNSGNMATQGVRLTFGMWDYRATMDIEVGGNCTGLVVIQSAVSTAYRKLPESSQFPGMKELVMHHPDSTEPEDTLDCCTEEDQDGEDWLAEMLISAEIISITPKP